MKTEELTALGLTEEQAAKIFAMNGKDITAEKAKFADYEDIKAKLKAFEGVDIDTVKKSAEDWKAKYETDTKALTEKLQKQALDSKIDFALTNAKAKNLKAVKALLKSDTIKFDGEKLEGLNEQLLEITKESPYLFGENTQNPPPGNGSAVTAPSQTLSAAVAEHYKTN